MTDAEYEGKSRACPLTVQEQYDLQQTQTPWEVLSHVSVIRPNS